MNNLDFEKLIKKSKPNFEFHQEFTDCIMMQVRNQIKMKKMWHIDKKTAGISITAASIILLFSQILNFNIYVPLNLMYYKTFAYLNLIAKLFGI